MRLLIVLTLIAATQGCAAIRQRAEAASRIVDIGMTLSTRPQVRAFFCFAGLAQFSAGMFQGHSVGLVDGKVGAFGYDRTQSGCNGVSCAIPGPTVTEPGLCEHHMHLMFLGVLFNVRWPALWRVITGGD
jgi:hypothetical protein